MSNVVSIDAGKPHVVFEAICIGCHHRYMAVVPDGVKLIAMECGGCGLVGKVIATGEPIED